MSNSIGVIAIAVSVGLLAWVLGTILADIITGKFIKFVQWFMKGKKK